METKKRAARELGYLAARRLRRDREKTRRVSPVLVQPAKRRLSAPLLWSSARIWHTWDNVCTYISALHACPGDLPVHRQRHQGEVRVRAGQRAVTSRPGHPVQELRHGRTRGGEDVASPTIEVARGESCGNPRCLHNSTTALIRGVPSSSRAPDVHARFFAPATPVPLEHQTNVVPHRQVCVCVCSAVCVFSPCVFVFCFSSPLMDHGS